jgi:hypothetical protein
MERAFQLDCIHAVLRCGVRVPGLERLMFQVWETRRAFEELVEHELLELRAQRRNALPSEKARLAVYTPRVAAFTLLGDVQRAFLASPAWSTFWRAIENNADEKRFRAFLDSYFERLKPRYEADAIDIVADLLRARTQCGGCGVLDAQLCCSQCRGPYCTPACQAAHWPQHKASCKHKKRALRLFAGAGEGEAAAAAAAETL